MSPLSLFRKKPRPEPRPTLTLRSRSSPRSVTWEQAEHMGLIEDDAVSFEDAMVARVPEEDWHE